MFSKDEFFLRLANKTSHGEHVGMMLLDSFAESDKCSHDACKIYLKWRNKMMCDGVNDQEMRKILWNVLHTTENGDARDFLKDSLNDHDLQLATAAQLATNTASTS